MDKIDHEDFQIILAELFGALDKPLTDSKREGFWKGLSKMSILDFARCRDLLLGELSDGEQRKTFSVSDIWQAKNRLRARALPPQQKPSDEVVSSDPWWISSNHHLLAYLIHPMRKLTPEETLILVAAKNKWAKQMHEGIEADGSVEPGIQRDIWRNLMREAERTIEMRRIETIPMASHA